MPELCNTFRKQAGHVWRKMQKAQSLGISLSEETITETILYEIALAHQGIGDISICLATKPKEAKHGGDWEWWLVRNGSAKSFRVQAKRLFHDGRYQSLLKSKATPYEQTDKLVTSAKRDGHTPLYCFYNFNHRHGDFRAPDTPCIHDYRGPSYWGCTLALPDMVMNAASDELKDLRTLMQPWHKLVCECQNGLPDAALQFLAKLRGDTLTATDTTKMYRATPAQFDLQVYKPRDPAEREAREVPNYVSRLIELDRSRSSERGFLDSRFWAEEDNAPGDIGGIAVFDDRRG